VSLLPVLAERGMIDAGTRDRLLATLAVGSYAAVPPSAGLLITALHTQPPLAVSDMVRVFSSLGRQGAVPAQSAATVAQVCRSLATDPVRLVPPERAAQLSLEALAVRIPRRLAAILVETAASETLRLLPQDLEAVRRVCREFGRT